MLQAEADHGAPAQAGAGSQAVRVRGVCEVNQQLALDLAPARLSRPAVLMDMAKLQADVNIGRGSAKACTIDPAFIDKASVHMLRYLRAHGTSSGELLTDSCKLAGIKSTDDRHFGAVFRSLIRLGLIRWAGDARRVRGHGSRGGSLYQEVIR